jgi:hypothetical protein
LGGDAAARVEHDHPGIDDMVAPGQPAQHCAGMGRILGLIQDDIIEYNDRIGGDNNTVRGVYASRVSLAPGPQSRVIVKREWSFREAGHNQGRRVLLLFSVGCDNPEWNAEATKQLPPARRAGCQDEINRFRHSQKMNDE